MLDCFHCGFHSRVTCVIWKASNVTLCGDGLFKVTAVFKGRCIFIATDQKGGHTLQLPRARKKDRESAVARVSHYLAPYACICLLFRHTPIDLLMAWQGEPNKMALQKYQLFCIP